MPISAFDIKGLSQLVITATTSITEIVEAMHHTVTRPPFLSDPAGRTSGITGLVYGCVRGVTRAVGVALDLSYSPLEERWVGQASSNEREAFMAALNGVVGDHLQATQNPLALQMALRAHEAPEEAPHRAVLDAPVTDRLAVLVHGVCMNDRQWQRNGHDHGAALARDLGYTPLYLHYNSGLHISTNGCAFAELLEQTLAQRPQPVKELVFIGHSMGGLVSRSACHAAAAAGHAWPRLLRKIVFLGTPHHGAPLERGGNWVNLILGAAPYAAPLMRLGHLRSAGITDLRYGYLRDEEWADVDRFAHTPDNRRPLPLPDGVQCFAMAASMGEGEHNLAGALLGDGLVPLAGALGQHGRSELQLDFPKSRQWIGRGMNHLDLLDRPEVYAQLKAWLT